MPNIPLVLTLEPDTTSEHATPALYGLAAIILVIAWLVFAWPWLQGEVTIPWDAKAHFAPQVQFMAASIGRGEWPFWTPFAFSGHPQVADPQSMLFSPPMLLTAITTAEPSLWLIDTVVLSMLLIAGLGTLWLSSDAGWHWAGGLIAALGLAFGAAMAWRLQHFGQVFSLAYFPFALLFLRRALERSSLKYGLLSGATAAFIVLGRNQVGLLCLYLLVGYTLYHWLTNAPLSQSIRKSILPLAAGSVVALAMVSLPILMTLHLATLSNRPSIDYAGAAAGSLHPALLVTWLAPHVFGPAGAMADYWGPPSFIWQDTGLFIAQNMGLIYIGAIPAMLIIIGAIRGIYWQPAIRYQTISLILVLLYALGGYTPAFRVFYELFPAIDLYRRPADAVFLIGALSALLAGYSAHSLLTAYQVTGRTPAPTRAQLTAITATPLVIFALTLGFAVHFDRLIQAAPALLMAAGWIIIAGLAITLALWLNAIRPLLAGFLLIAPTAIDLAGNNGPNGASALPAASLEMLNPKTTNETILLLKQQRDKATTATHRPRFELAGLGFHWPNASQTHSLEHTLGYNPVRMRLYSETVGAGDTIGLPEQRKFTKLFPSYNSTLANLLGLRFIATGIEINKIDKSLDPIFATSSPLKFITRTKDAFIYENTAALPRVLFATHAQKANFEAIIKTGIWPNINFQTTVLLEQIIATKEDAQPKPAAKHTIIRNLASARILSYTNTVIEIATTSTTGGWLVLNDIWHPWWRAEVNGRVKTIHRANVLFRAVKVPPGKIKIRFIFQPFALRPIAGTLKTLIHH